VVKTKKGPIRRRKTRNGSLMVEKVSLSLLPGTKAHIEKVLPPNMSFSVWVEDAISYKFEAIRRTEMELINAEMAKMTEEERKAVNPQRLEELSQQAQETMRSNGKIR